MFTNFFENTYSKIQSTLVDNYPSQHQKQSSRMNPLRMATVISWVGVYAIFAIVLSSCARSGVLVSERTDSEAKASLYVQKQGADLRAYEVYSARQIYGLGRSLKSLESDSKPWAVLGGNSFRATENQFSESLEPSLLMTGVTIPDYTLPSLTGKIKGTTNGIPIEDILKTFQRQIDDPVYIVFLGVISTGDLYNNNQTDDYQDALVQVIVAPQNTQLKPEVQSFFPARKRKFSDDPIYNGVLVPLTDRNAISLQEPETMRYAVKTVENLRRDTRLKACNFIAFNLADIEIR